MSDEDKTIETLTTEEKIDIILFALSAIATSVAANSRESQLVLAGVSNALPAPSVSTLRRLDAIARKSQTDLMSGMRKEMPEIFPTNPNAS